MIMGVQVEHPHLVRGEYTRQVVLDHEGRRYALAEGG